MQTLVLIPGLGSDAAVWQRTIALLGDKVRCLVGDTLSDNNLPGMARRILAAAPDRFALAGVSMGGMVALNIVKIAPERVTQLALIDTLARPDSLKRKLSRHVTNLVVRVGDFRLLAEGSLRSLVHPSTPQDVRSELTEMSVRVGAKTYVRQSRAVAIRDDLRAVLAKVAVPTAVIVGREDRTTPVEMSNEIHTLIAGSTLHIIPDCGHLPPNRKA